MAWIKPSVSQPRTGTRSAMPPSVSLPRPAEDDTALSLREQNGLVALVDLLQRRRHLRRRAELIQWKSEFRNVVEAMRAEQASSGTR